MDGCSCYPGMYFVEPAKPDILALGADITANLHSNLAALSQKRITTDIKVQSLDQAQQDLEVRMDKLKQSTHHYYNCLTNFQPIQRTQRTEIAEITYIFVAYLRLPQIETCIFNSLLHCPRQSS